MRPVRLDAPHSSGDPFSGETSGISSGDPMILYDQNGTSGPWWKGSWWKVVFIGLANPLKRPPLKMGGQPKNIPKPKYEPPNDSPFPPQEEPPTIEDLINKQMKEALDVLADLLAGMSDVVIIVNPSGCLPTPPYGTTCSGPANRY